jgi:hypothetical protein
VRFAEVIGLVMPHTAKPMGIKKISKGGRTFYVPISKDPRRGEGNQVSKIFTREQLPQWTAKKLAVSDHNFTKKIVKLDWIKPVQQERIESFKEEQTNNILNGTYMPIVVDRKGYIVNGHHRYDAFKELGITEVKVIIVDENIDTLVDNFADGKKKGRKGLSKRVGVSQKMSIAKLKKIAKTASGERKRMAQWNLNMKRGRARKK